MPVGHPNHYMMEKIYMRQLNKSNENEDSLLIDK